MQRTLAVVIGALVAVSASFATSISPLDLPTLKARSTLVVTGYVLRVRLVREDKVTLEREATIRVDGVLLGRYEQPTLRLRLRQGFVFFDRIVTKGDGGVFFLVPAENGAFDQAYPGSIAL